MNYDNIKQKSDAPFGAANPCCEVVPDAQSKLFKWNNNSNNNNTNNTNKKSGALYSAATPCCGAAPDAQLK